MTSSIDIELKDKDGNPVPDEPYRVRDSADRMFTGVLDDQGFGPCGRRCAGRLRNSLPEPRSVGLEAGMTLVKTPCTARGSHDGWSGRQ